jgi:hypothetical protein
MGDQDLAYMDDYPYGLDEMDDYPYYDEQNFIEDDLYGSSAEAIKSSELSDDQKVTLENFASLPESHPKREEILFSASGALFDAILKLQYGTHTLTDLIGSPVNDKEPQLEDPGGTSPGFFHQTKKEIILHSRRGLVVGSNSNTAKIAKLLRKSRPRSPKVHKSLRDLTKSIIRRTKKVSDRFLGLVQCYLIGHLIRFESGFPSRLEEYSTYHGNGVFQISKRLPFVLLREVLKCLPFRSSSITIHELKTLAECKVRVDERSSRLCKKADGRFHCLA